MGRRQQRQGGLAEPPAISGGKPTEGVDVRQDEASGPFEAPLPERAARGRRAAGMQNADDASPMVEGQAKKPGGPSRRTR